MDRAVCRRGKLRWRASLLACSAASGVVVAASQVGATDDTGSGENVAAATSDVGADQDVVTLIAPEPAVVGVAAGPPIPGPVRNLVPTYWTDVVTSPSGDAVVIGSNFGPVPPVSQGSAVERNGVLMIVTEGAMTTVRFDLGCASAEIVYPPELSDVEQEALLDAVVPMEGGGLHVSLPDGWTSFGGGFLGPMVTRALTVEVDGQTNRLHMSQHFDTPPGALMRVSDIAVVDVDGRPALVHGFSGDEPTLVVGFGNDTVTLSGTVSVEQLVEVAATLGPADEYELPPDMILPHDPDSPQPACPVVVA